MSKSKSSPIAPTSDFAGEKPINFSVLKCGDEYFDLLEPFGERRELHIKTKQFDAIQCVEVGDYLFNWKVLSYTDLWLEYAFDKTCAGEWTMTIDANTIHVDENPNR